MSKESSLPKTFRPVLKLISDQYLADERPWYLGFSGGKDSTALFAAVYLALQGQSAYRKPVILLYCDTGVEIPIIAEYVGTTLKKIASQAKRDGIPLEIRVLKPRLDDRFFVKVIGRGYPPPSNKFRWCTDRLRVGPVRREMQKASNAQSMMLLGTRWNESPERKRTLARFSTGGRYHFKQAGNAKTMIFAPLADISTKEVWEFLHSKWIPKSLDIEKLSLLYRSASGRGCTGRCEACEECKGGRFGCWTCTVIRKDRAVHNMVDDGHPELAPLLRFRNWMACLRESRFRWRRRRNGAAGLGPLNMKTRRMILSRLQDVEAETKWKLILPEEIRLIKKYWQVDEG